MLWQVVRYAVGLAVFLAASIYLIVCLFTDPIVHIFNSEGNRELVAIAKTGIRLYFTGFLFAGINILAAAFLSAVMRPKLAFIISVTRGGAVIIPLVLLLSLAFGMEGVWLSFTLSEFITCLLSVGGVIKCRAELFGKSKISYGNKAQNTV